MRQALEPDGELRGDDRPKIKPSDMHGKLEPDGELLIYNSSPTTVVSKDVASNSSFRSVEDLHPGDILCIRPETWTDKVYCLLTGEEVSHVALVLTNNPLKAYEVDNQGRTSISRVQKYANRSIIIKRFQGDDNVTDLDPVLKAANKYLVEDDDNNTDIMKFSFAQLYTIVMLLLVSDESKLSKTANILNWCLKKIIPLLIKYCHGKHRPMMPAEFVYRCFQDAGSEYELQLEKHPTVADHITTTRRVASKSILEAVMEKLQCDEISTSDRLQNLVFQTVDSDDCENNNNNHPEEDNQERLMQKLYDILLGPPFEMEPVDDDDENHNEIDDKVQQSIIDFACLNYAATTTTKRTNSNNNNADNEHILYAYDDKEKCVEAIRSIAESFLMTPADLSRHCDDLKFVGKFKIQENDV